MFYLDTSFIIAALTRDERGSEAARNWLELAEPEALLVSDWVKTEVSSALSLKVRTGQFDLEARAAALSHWRSLVTNSFSVIAVRADDFESAARFAERHELGLRAGDALHLAVAQGAAATLVTLDRRMANAALELGLPLAKVIQET